MAEGQSNDERDCAVFTGSEAILTAQAIAETDCLSVWEFVAKWQSPCFGS